jgi:hypothetical protein
MVNEIIKHLSTVHKLQRGHILHEGFLLKCTGKDHHLIGTFIRTVANGNVNPQDSFKLADGMTWDKENPVCSSCGAEIRL